MKRLYSLTEAATFLGRTPGAVRELVYRGKVPSVRIDRKMQFDVRDLEKLVAEKRVETPEELR